MNQVMRDHAPRIAAKPKQFVPGKLTLPSWQLTTAPLAVVKAKFEEGRK